MSDIETMVQAIADGKYSEADDAFQSVMASKVSDRLDAMKVDVAQNMFRSESSEADDQDEVVDAIESEVEETSDDEL